MICFIVCSFDSVKVGSLVFADQLLQLSTLLPSHFIYGLGEHNAPLLKSTGWTQYTMWNYDMPPSDRVKAHHQECST